MELKKSTTNSYVKMKNFFEENFNPLTISFSVIGFIISVFILTFNDYSKDHLFHEISFDPRHSIDTLLDLRKEFIDKKIETLNTAAAHSTPAAGAINAELSAKLKSINDSLINERKLYLATQREQQNIKSFNTDTSFKYFMNYLSFNHSTFYDSLNSDNLNFDRSYVFVPYVIIDTFSYSRDTLNVKNDKLKFSIVPFPTKISFLSKYPIFGYWLVLAIIQMTMWFLLIPIVFGMMLKIKINLPGYSGDLWAYLSNCLLPLVIVAIFVFIFYHSLIDVNAVIKDSYFMTSFNSRMALYSIPGYLLAILSFGGYLYLSKMLDKIKDENKLSDDELQSLKSSFNFLFLLCAIILSFLVVWIGVSFIAINSMESMKYYSLISGKLFLNNDFIYLVGLIHSLLLIIFYLPIQLKFKTFNMPGAQTTQQDGQTDVKSFFPSLFSNLGTVLITSAPLITSIIQGLLNSFLKV